MYNIGEFFKRVQNVRMKDVLIRDVVVGAVKKVIGVTIKPDDITISSTVITLKGISAAAKSEIFIKKQVLIEEINRSKIKKVTDVK
jgi:hypothetical protein